MRCRQSGTRSQTETGLDFDAIVIGAGVAGLYQLYKLRELGLRVRVFEAGAAVGGTWYWNRYPGARFDSESHTYGYSFSQGTAGRVGLEERFAPQPETERYLNYVADKFDLRRDIQLNSRVAAAHYHEETRSWEMTLEDGSRYSARFLVTAIGILSAPTMPNIPGIGTFKGVSCHTHAWPREGGRFRRQARRDYRHRRDRGADDPGNRQNGRTADRVPAHPELVRAAAQRQDFRRGDARHPGALRRNLRALPGDRRAATSTTRTRARPWTCRPEEREAFWEKLYASPGFGIWMGNFSDMLTDRAANASASDFIARKIRQRVKDPKVAEKLIPKNHGFGTRRVPLETGYYEVYNQPNVELVDINETPIERITPTGIQDQRARVRIRHHHLCDRFRRDHRRL